MERKGAVLERITNVVAGGGITYPYWETQLQHVGAVADQLVPILSAAWLVLQMVLTLIKKLREGRL